jgi:hypothetical protein
MRPQRIARAGPSNAASMLASPGLSKRPPWACSMNSKVKCGQKGGNGVRRLRLRIAIAWTSGSPACAKPQVAESTERVTTGLTMDQRLRRISWGVARKV